MLASTSSSQALPTSISLPTLDQSTSPASPPSPSTHSAPSTPPLSSSPSPPTISPSSSSSLSGSSPPPPGRTRSQHFKRSSVFFLGSKSHTLGSLSEAETEGGGGGSAISLSSSSDGNRSSEDLLHSNGLGGHGLVRSLSGTSLKSESEKKKPSSTRRAAQNHFTVHSSRNRIRNSTLIMFNQNQKPGAAGGIGSTSSPPSPSSSSSSSSSTNGTSNGGSSNSNSGSGSMNGVGVGIGGSSQAVATPDEPVKANKPTKRAKQEKFDVIFALASGGPLVQLRVSAKKTASEIKEQLLEDAKPLMQDMVSVGLMKKRKSKALLKKTEQYVLKIVGADYMLTNESLPLHRIGIMQMYNQSHVRPKLEMIPKNWEEEGDKERESRFKKRLTEDVYINSDIKKLLSSDLLKACLDDANLEIIAFRKTMTKIRMELQEGDDIERTLFPRYTDTEPLPLVVSPQVHFVCHFLTEDNMKSQFVCKTSDTAVQLIERAFKKIAMAYKELMSQRTPADYILKVTGYREYLYGDIPILSYDYIRKCMSKELPIWLTLVEKASVANTEEVLASREPSLVDQVLSVHDTEDEDTSDISALENTFRLKLINVEHLPKRDVETEDSLVFVVAELFHAGVPIGLGTDQSAPTLTSSIIENNPSPKWNQWVYFNNVKTCDLPRGTRICFTIYRRLIPNNDPSTAWQKGLDSKDIPLAWVSRSLFDHRGFLRDGCESLRMWPKAKADPVGTISENVIWTEVCSPPVLHLEFEGYMKLVEARPIPSPMDSLEEVSLRMNAFNSPENAVKVVKLDALLAQDPLTALNSDDKRLIYEGRYYCIQRPHALAKFLESVCWHDHEQVAEAYRLLPIWRAPSPLQALELLDAKFADPIVRAYAVKQVENFSDGETFDFLLQLTQVLKHELFHDSALVRYLLRKAWGSTKIGHAFYWHLKAEQHIPEIAERYTLILESFLRGCGPHRKELAKQAELVKKLAVIAEKIKKINGAELRKEVLSAELRRLQLPPRFQLPLDQRMEAKALIVEKCKYMDSKKLPLWLVFENVEPIGKPITVIFKCGDDLRQDVLTLQMIRIMDKLWKTAGLDLLLNPYGACVTGNMEGMIEVVLNAETTANINKAAGGAHAVLKENTLKKWIVKNNTNDYQKAQQTFMLSCAGYCVATYVLGIGDRHNDNIMVTKSGHLFHIDFGHFLGNFKEKFGFKRERAPFVFVPQYAAVLGGLKDPVFNTFVETCGKAYNILRKHASGFINLFMMMLCTGIPELQTLSDIEYLRDAFLLKGSDDEAAEHFSREIMRSHNTKTTLANDFIHVVAHS